MAIARRHYIAHGSEGPNEGLSVRLIRRSNQFDRCVQKIDPTYPVPLRVVLLFNIVPIMEAVFRVWDLYPRIEVDLNLDRIILRRVAHGWIMPLTGRVQCDLSRFLWPIPQQIYELLGDDGYMTTDKYRLTEDHLMMSFKGLKVRRMRPRRGFFEENHR